MTWHAIVRVRNPDIDEADYTLTAAGAAQWHVWHSGQHAGRIAIATDGTWWSATPAATWNSPDYADEPIGNADTMADAVALLHHHWSEQP